MPQATEPRALPAMPEFVTIGGRRLEVRTIPATRSAAPTCVFLHEGIGSVSLWRDFPDQVAAATGCAVLIYSRHGYGQSEIADAPFAPDYMHHEALETLPSLLAGCRIERPILIGHSDGASIALIYAGAGPRDRPIGGVIALAPHVFVEDASIAGITAALDAFKTTDLRARLARHHRDPARTFQRWNDAWLDPGFRDWNIERLLPAIHVPVMAIQGYADNYGTMAQLDAIAAQVSGPCELVRLDQCGHSPHRDQTAATLAAVTRFIAARN